MVDRNTVRMENVEVNLSAECPDDGTQVDSRVVVQQRVSCRRTGAAPQIASMPASISQRVSGSGTPAPADPGLLRWPSRREMS